jgi:hypothetical protein
VVIRGILPKVSSMENEMPSRVGDERDLWRKPFIRGVEGRGSGEPPQRERACLDARLLSARQSGPNGMYDCSHSCLPYPAPSRPLETSVTTVTTKKALGWSAEARGTAPLEPMGATQK